MKVLFIIPIKKSDVTPSGKNKEKAVVIDGDSVVRNVPSLNLNQSLKEHLSVKKSFLGAKQSGKNNSMIQTKIAASSC